MTECLNTHTYRIELRMGSYVVSARSDRDCL